MHFAYPALALFELQLSCCGCNCAAITPLFAVLYSGLLSLMAHATAGGTTTDSFFASLRTQLEAGAAAALGKRHHTAAAKSVIDWSSAHGTSRPTDPRSSRFGVRGSAVARGVSGTDFTTKHTLGSVSYSARPTDWLSSGRAELPPVRVYPL